MADDKPMTRCECQEVEFCAVLKFARRTGIYRVEGLCDLLNVGRTCTACHDDLRDAIEKKLGPPESPEWSPAEECAEGIPANAEASKV